jgi:hypothetical protein
MAITKSSVGQHGPSTNAKVGPGAAEEWASLADWSHTPWASFQIQISVENSVCPDLLTGQSAVDISESSQVNGKKCNQNQRPYQVQGITHSENQAHTDPWKHQS